jgi:hypothetical protein
MIRSLTCLFYGNNGSNRPAAKELLEDEWFKEDGREDERAREGGRNGEEGELMRMGPIRNFLKGGRRRA